MNIKEYQVMKNKLANELKAELALVAPLSTNAQVVFSEDFSVVNVYSTIVNNAVVDVLNFTYSVNDLLIEVGKYTYLVASSNLVKGLEADTTKLSYNATKSVKDVFDKFYEKHELVSQKEE